jgi:DHA1 family tetracycline resistance protein-like MFS transporter
VMGLMTRRVASDEQGQLQGASSSLMGVTGLIGPGLFTSVFAWSIADAHALHMPGIAVLLAAGFMAAALAVTTRIGPAPEPQRQ